MQIVTPMNYRPISILTSFSKIFEKLLYNRLCYHIRDNHILANEGFGFRQASSTTSAFYHSTNNILSALNSKLLVGGIFCDLQKTFDSVTVDKLVRYYLQNRHQRVLVNSDSNKHYSKWEPVTVGVPQGSILCPLLFLLYVNDMPNVISDISKPVLYADDTSLIITNSDTQLFEKDINSTIQRLNTWFYSNLLVLN
jgi:hypothetical protein